MLKLKIYQENAHYRIYNMIPYMSYPLVPPGTVYGFLRAICDKASINYQNTRLFIIGKYSGISMEKERLILFSEYKVKSRTKVNTMAKSKTNIIKIQKLHRVETIIYLNSSNEIENMIIQNIIRYQGGFRLGRSEDLIIDFEYNKINEDDFGQELNDDSYYVYVNLNNNINGALFRLMLDTEVDQNLKIIDRVFVNLLYTSVTRLQELNWDDLYFRHKSNLN